MKEPNLPRKLNIGFIIKGLNAYTAHIKPFIDNAPDNLYNYFVFHINNLYSPSFSISDSNIITINLLKVMNVRKELQSLNIDVMISINPGNIFDLFFLSVCKLLSIKTIYFQHGIQLDFNSFDLKTIRQDQSLKRKSHAIRKYIFYCFCFIYNIINNKNRGLLLKTVYTKTIHLFFSSNKSKLPKYGLKENHCDFAFVYGDSDKKYLIESMKMEANNIFISGYPFIQIASSIEKNEATKSALYFSSALRAAGVIPITKKQEKITYQKLCEQVNKANFKLVLKLHPFEDIEIFKSYFNYSHNILIIKDANLADLTLNADVVIGEYTTALFYAIKYFKPIIILKSEYFEEYPFDYTKYGIGVKTDLGNLSKCLINCINLNYDKKKKYHDFLNKYLNSYNGESSYKIFYKQLPNLCGPKKLN